MGRPEGGGDRGSRPPPLKNHKNIGFFSNTGPEPMKNQVSTSQHSMLGHHRPASKTLLALFGSSLPHYLKEKNVRVGPPLTKLSGSAHADPGGGESGLGYGFVWILFLS